VGVFLQNTGHNEAATSRAHATDFCFFSRFFYYSSADTLCLPMLLGCSSVNSSINGFPFFWAMFLLLVCGHIVPAYAVGVQLRE
jgi:hypothetical protein